MRIERNQNDTTPHINNSIQPIDERVISTNKLPDIQKGGVDVNHVSQIVQKASKTKKICYLIFGCLLIITGTICILSAVIMYTKKETITTTFQYLSWTDTYGVLLTEADGRLHSKLKAEPQQKFLTHIDISLIQEIKTENISQTINNQTITDDPGIAEVYAHSHYHYRVNITGTANSSVQISVKRYLVNGGLEEDICNETIILNDNYISYNCSHNGAGYYLVHYNVPLSVNGSATGHIDYDRISINNYNGLKNCSIEMSVCSVSLNWNRKYKVIALVHSISFQNNRQLLITMETLHAYWYIFGSVLLCIIAVGVISAITICIRKTSHKIVFCNERHARNDDNEREPFVN